MHIAVLFGGLGGERAVSAASGLRVCEALLSRGHRVAAFDYRGEVDTALLPWLSRADAVFLALHGGGGEGGALQAALDGLGLPHYTGSAAEGAAAAMDKARAKAIVAAAGLPVTKSVLWQVGEAAPQIDLPAIIKPLCGGSSVGLSVLSESTPPPNLSPTEPMLIEPYLPGREYTVSLLDGKALPVVEIRPRDGIYDYHHKYTKGACEELCPAPIAPEKAAVLQKMALTAFEALGLRDYARIDFKESDTGLPYFLEANTLPGMTETSLLPLAAAKDGVDFPILCEKIAALAAARKPRQARRS